jgi:hypothetical protein
MRHWPILILVAICGCTSSEPKPPASTTAVEERHPVVAREVEVTIGDGREITAPLGSATAGSKWIEHTVTYTNKSGHPIWIVGYSATHPFSGIETRAIDGRDWRDYGLGYCGTGAGELEIAPSTFYSFTAALPEKYVGQEFRVMLPYRTERGGQHWVQAASEARKLGRPAAG